LRGNDRLDIEDLRVRIGRAVAAVGRERDAKGAGNATKRIRMWTDLAMGEGELRERVRRGGGADS
jgi:hypothetical protein